jgi:hypothetical protein
VEAHRIEKKDPVFCSVKRNCRSVSKRSACNEPDLHVLACINGVAKARRQKSTYAYIGVSNTHVDSEQNRHAPVTVAGLTAIIILTMTKCKGPHHDFTTLRLTTSRLSRLYDF